VTDCAHVGSGHLSLPRTHGLRSSLGLAPDLFRQKLKLLLHLHLGCHGLEQSLSLKVHQKDYVVASQDVALAPPECKWNAKCNTFSRTGCSGEGS